ncbi:hypothetical protein I6M59_07165 [Shewanella algae]|uniref:hypothetical protein n=1 Tax=Shewanella algae TaxID=38313 RepID=UPI00118733A1|nr:hypothetical protein [Shewanella algae]MBO2581726.1 hypothetical protein [Shewanella algae]MBO2691527.1 hypothetical protein [Shewanella algae]TVO94801.1 hypothetical protein AYI86_16765 [Shewanella algae]BCV31909.1 hypothetical protein TUM4442_14360 [Shewanella algae]
MAEGLVTFFKYEQFGFYKRSSGDESYCEPLDMSCLLDELVEWHQSRANLPDTLPWNNETPGYENRKKVYLKSIERNEETGDYLLILWRAVGGGDGVYGIAADAALDDDELYNANEAANGRDVIWGEAAYYWFIPELEVFASLKFSRSVADTLLLNRYLRDYIELHSALRPKNIEEKDRQSGHPYLSISFPSAHIDANLWLRITSKQISKITQEADLEAMARDITHLVKREEISAVDSGRGSWERLLSGLPYVSSRTSRLTRKVEVIIEAKPTANELREMLETYHDNYAGGIDRWVNVGFRKDGAGGTVWLNKYVLKNTLVVSDIGGGNDTGHYTVRRLFAALQLKRDSLLAPLGTVRRSSFAA